MDILAPQPAPKAKGQVVYYSLLTKRQFKPEIKELLRRRFLQGMEKYGQPLMSDDGRDNDADLIQELIDAVFYCQKAILQDRQDEPTLDDIIRVLENVYFRQIKESECK